MDYAYYSSTDFVLDDYFFQWVIQADENSERFWKAWLRQHPHKRKEIEEAKSWILLLHSEFNKAEIDEMPQKEQMWKRIMQQAKKKANTQPSEKQPKYSANEHERE